MFEIRDIGRKIRRPLTIREINQRLNMISARCYSIAGCQEHFEAIRDLQRDISLRGVLIWEPYEGHLLEVLQDSIGNQCEILFGERIILNCLGTNYIWEGAREQNLDRIRENQENLKRAGVVTSDVITAHRKEHRCGDPPWEYSIKWG